MMNDFGHHVSTVNHVPTRAFEIIARLSDGSRHTYRTVGREMPTAQPGQVIVAWRELAKGEA